MSVSCFLGLGRGTGEEMEAILPSSNKPTFITRVMRWGPVVLLLLTISWSYYAFVYEFCFNVLTNCTQKAIYLIVFHLLLLFYLASYFRAMFGPLAVPPKSFWLSQEYLNELNQCVDKSAQNEVLDRFVVERNLPVLIRRQGAYAYCDKCLAIKPDRAHHCRACQRCILRMDHHCPWLNKCVGFLNYKFFLLILFYGFIMCLFVLITILPYYVKYFLGDEQLDDNPNSNRFTRMNVLLVFFVACFIAVPTFCMIYMHSVYLATNMTTIEEMQSWVYSDLSVQYQVFQLKSKLQNWQQIFGESFLLWIFPVFTTMGDGIVYPHRKADSVA